MVKPSGSEEERGFQALLEAVESKVEAFGDQVISLGQKIDKVAGDLSGQLTALDGKVDLHTRTVLSELRAVGLRLDVHERTHKS